MRYLIALIQSGFQSFFGLLQVLSPRLAEVLAERLFFRPGKKRQRASTSKNPEALQIRKVPFRGYYPRSDEKFHYTSYTKGQGDTILLVHGWGGASSQFRELMEGLVQAHYKVVSFDAPAHGRSPGVRTNLLEFGQIIEELSLEHGPFHSVVAHSLGAIAGARALRGGLESQRFVSIGAPATIEFILEEFARRANANQRTVRALRSHLDGLAQGSANDFSLSHLLPSIKQEVLIVHDENDRSVHFSQGRELSQTCPSRKFLHTQGLGHNRVLSDPNVISQILSFMDAESC